MCGIVYRKAVHSSVLKHTVVTCEIRRTQCGTQVLQCGVKTVRSIIDTVMHISMRILLLDMMEHWAPGIALMLRLLSVHTDLRPQRCRSAFSTKVAQASKTCYANYTACPLSRLLHQDCKRNHGSERRGKWGDIKEKESYILDNSNSC